MFGKYLHTTHTRHYIFYIGCGWFNNHTFVVKWACSFGNKIYIFKIWEFDYNLQTLYTVLIWEKINANNDCTRKLKEENYTVRLVVVADVLPIYEQIVLNNLYAFTHLRSPLLPFLFVWFHDHFLLVFWRVFRKTRTHLFSHFNGGSEQKLWRGKWDGVREPLFWSNCWYISNTFHLNNGMHFPSSLERNLQSWGKFGILYLNIFYARRPRFRSSKNNHQVHMGW